SGPKRIARTRGAAATAGPGIRSVYAENAAIAALSRSRRRISALEEALVAAGHHLGLHLAEDVECDACHDQDGGAAQRAGGRLREVGVMDEEARRDRNRGEEQCAGEGQPAQYAAKVAGGRGSRADAGDVAAVLAQVVGLVVGIELNPGVE